MARTRERRTFEHGEEEEQGACPDDPPGCRWRPWARAWPWWPSLGGQAIAQSPSAAAPQPNEQPAALTADLTSYPNYGGGVDCENGTFNGLPYSGNLKSIDAPDANTVVFTFCNPNVAFLAADRIRLAADR